MEVTYFLKQFSLFSSLNVDAIRKYFEPAEKASFKKDETVVDYNEKPEYLFVILKGSAHVLFKGSASEEYKIDTLQPGDTFGEIALLSEEAQPLRIKADKALEVLKLDKKILYELIELNPKLNKKFYKLLVKRLHHIYSIREEKADELIDESTRIYKSSERVLKRKEKELLFLDKVHHIIASKSHFKEKLSKITKGIANFYNIDMCLLYLFEDDDRYIRLYSANDFKKVYSGSYRLSRNDNVVRWIKDNKASLFLTDKKGGDTTEEKKDKEDELSPRNIKEFSKSKFLEEHNFKDLLFLPIVEDKNVVGLLSLLSKTDTSYSEEDMRFLEIITGNFIGIVRKEQFEYEANLRATELDTLRKISEAIQKKNSIKELLDHIMENTLSALHAKRCTLRLHDPLSGIIKIELNKGFDDEEYSTVKKGIIKHLKETVLDIGEYVIINDTSKIERFSDDSKKLVGSLISVPFQLHDKVIGMITVYDKREGSFIDIFDQNELRLLTAIATHTSIMIENARLYDELSYTQSGAKVHLKVATEILGISLKAKLVNDKIKQFSLNADPVLILGEVGIGKNFVGRCIHFSSNRMAYHFITEDCRNFSDKAHGADLFGKKRKNTKDEEIRGILELAHEGTLALRHVEELSKEVQKKLLNYLETKEYKKINGRKIHTSDVKIILQSNIDILKLVESGKFDYDLYKLISGQTVKLPPLRDRKKDLPMIIEHFLTQINDKFQKNVTNISDSAIGMLMSYDWPGNLMELYNVLERGVLVAPKDTILSEQIFLGIPRAEGKKTYNMLRFGWISRLFKSLYYPAVFQAFSVLVFLAILYFSFFSPEKGEQNPAIILSWIIGWPLLFMSYVLLGRIFCTVCPFSSISKFVQKFVNFGHKMPDTLKRRGNLIAVTFCFVIIWFEEVTNIYMSPYMTGSLILFIFSLTLLTSIFYERMVWCRYLCPWGILNGLFSMASILELRSNRHICLTQCKTNACYEGSETVPGCPMFEHPYGMESNKNCTLCGNCIKNCPNNSIQLNLRATAKELWIKVHPHLSDSILSISLAFLFILKKLLEIKSVNNLIFFGHERFSLYGGMIYTVLFILTISISYGVLSFISFGTVSKKNLDKSLLKENIGYAFIPLALSGFLSYFLEPLLLKGSFLVHAFKRFAFNGTFPENAAPLMTHTTIKNFQVVIILMGGFASLYSSYKIVMEKSTKFNEEELAFYKVPVLWLIIIMTVTYLVLI